MRVQSISYIVIAVCMIQTLGCRTGGSSPQESFMVPAETYRIESADFSNGGNLAPVTAAHITPTFFQNLQKPMELPVLGRTFQPEEYQQKSAVMILSHDFWRTRCGGNPAVIGQSVELNGQTYTVVGVMSKGFTFPPGTQLWLPMPEAAKAK